MKEEKEHALSTMCCVSHRSPFCTKITNNPFNRIVRELLALVHLHSFMWIGKELMDDLRASKSEARKLKTLAL